MSEKKSVLAFSLLSLALTLSFLAVPLLANQENDDQLDTNCIDGYCFGLVHFFVEDASPDVTAAISEFSCRIFGINLTPLEIHDLRENEYLVGYETLVFLVNDTDEIGDLHPLLTPPPQPSDVEQFGRRLEFAGDGQNRSINYAVIDLESSGCTTVRCALGRILGFVATVNGRNIDANEQRFNSGDYCAPTLAER